MSTRRLFQIAAVLLLASPAGAAKDDKAVTLLEMNNISQAMQMFYLDYSRLTTIENLDDTLASPANPPFQGINDNGGALVILPTSGTLFRQTLLSDPFGIGPPYLTQSSGHLYEGPSGDYDQGTPLDPWGTPYYFYSPLGLIEPKTDSVSLRYYGDAFDLYTIISHGPDTVKSSDDLYVQVPFSITTLRVSSARLRTSTTKAPGYTLLIKGYQLGASQGTGDVLFNGSAFGGSINQWTSTQITAHLASIPAAATTVSVRINGGATSPAITLTDETGSTTLAHWDVY